MKGTGFDYTPVGAVFLFREIDFDPADVSEIGGSRRLGIVVPIPENHTVVEIYNSKEMTERCNKRVRGRSGDQRLSDWRIKDSAFFCREGMVVAELYD